jgi:hypothetical protein
MNIEDLKLGEAAAESFKEYWGKSQEMLKEKGLKIDPAIVFSISLIYAAAFFNGYDYCKSKTKELAELN